jgi:protein subunit release factor A
MAAFTLKINGGEHRVDVDPQTLSSGRPATARD